MVVVVVLSCHFTEHVYVPDEPPRCTELRGDQRPQVSAAPASRQNSITMTERKKQPFWNQRPRDEPRQEPDKPSPHTVKGRVATPTPVVVFTWHFDEKRVVQGETPNCT